MFSRKIKNRSKVTPHIFIFTRDSFSTVNFQTIIFVAFTDSLIPRDLPLETRTHPTRFPLQSQTPRSFLNATEKTTRARTRRSLTFNGMKTHMLMSGSDLNFVLPILFPKMRWLFPQGKLGSKNVNASKTDIDVFSVVIVFFSGRRIFVRLSSTALLVVCSFQSRLAEMLRDDPAGGKVD